MIVTAGKDNEFKCYLTSSEYAYLSEVANKREISITKAMETITMSGLAMFVGFGILEKKSDEDSP